MMATRLFSLLSIAVAEISDLDLLEQNSGLSLMQIRASKHQRDFKSQLDSNKDGPEAEDLKAEGPEAEDLHADGPEAEDWVADGPEAGDWEADEPLTWPEQLNYPKFNIPVPIKIVVWSFSGYIPFSHIAENCTVDFMHDKQTGNIIADPDFDISDADVVLFGLPNMIWDFPNNYILPRTKRPNQMWVATCEEPYNRPSGDKEDCRLVNDTATMKVMDVLSTYDLNSDIPSTFEGGYVEDLKPMPDMTGKDKMELATVTVSDCGSEWRNAWVEDIIAEASKTGHKVLSYGLCYHNTEESGGDHHTGANKWVNRDAGRAFKLVAENVLQSGYVSEKVWAALAEGAVPVYLGPVDVKQWVPANSMLFAGDFPSTKALVDKMRSFTPADFAKANVWRTRPTSEWGNWERSWMDGRFTMLNRFCEKAATQKMAGTPFKSGTAPGKHNLDCCPEKSWCCMAGSSAGI